MMALYLMLSSGPPILPSTFERGDGYQWPAGFLDMDSKSER